MFWDIFYDLCVKNDTTPNPVCKELGFSNATATHWKNGSCPKGDALCLIADRFHCSVDYLLGREEPIWQNQSDNTPLAGLSENARRIVELFEDLTPTQQGEIIGRAALLAEQNEVEYIKDGA